MSDTVKITIITGILWLITTMMTLFYGTAEEETQVEKRLPPKPIRHESR